MVEDNLKRSATVARIDDDAPRKIADISKLKRAATTRRALKELKVYTRKEVESHNSEKDVWIIIDNQVYDITTWLHKHPGCYKVLLTVAGLDVSDPFRVYHPKKVFKRLRPFLVGTIKEEEQTEQSPLSKDLFALREKFEAMGLYNTDYTYLMGTIVELLALLAVAYYCAAYTTSWLSQIFGACCLGFYFQQIAFIGHDLGHTGVTHNWAWDYLLGSILMLPGGLSVSWWKLNHNTHHVLCNSVENDPDIQHMPFVAVDSKVFENSYWSTYYKKWFIFGIAEKFLLSKQHYLTPLIFCFSRYNLYVHSLTTLLKEYVRPLNRKIELIGFFLYHMWVVALCAQTGSWKRGIAFFLISHAVGGFLLSVQIGMSHWSLPVVHGNPEHTDWFRHQLTTSMDIDCSPWVDFFHGGLQFQTIHHLFPRIPRCHLREAREYARELCKKHGVKYQSDTFYNAVRDMWVKFAEVAESASKAPIHDFDPRKLKQT